MRTGSSYKPTGLSSRLKLHYLMPVEVLPPPPIAWLLLGNPAPVSEGLNEPGPRKDEPLRTLHPLGEGERLPFLLRKAQGSGVSDLR